MSIKVLNKNEILISGEHAASLFRSIFTDREMIERYVTAQIPEAVHVYGMALGNYPFNNKKK